MTDALLANLRGRANRRGLMLVHADALQSAFRCSPEELNRALRALGDSGRLEILTPPPFLVLALKPRPWSGSTPARVQEEQQISASARSPQEEVPVSSAVAAIQQREVGGAGEGEALLETVLAALGPEANRAEFARILAGHPAAVIHKCLQRVRATKAIRVSKAALFRALLTKLSH